ncbi:MAG TPA: OmpH family outer membrane protein [Cyclobacteriaceae bacterium]|jgi:outer membrane protein|nr:OmpH family outer membrane protein [Cyclobacteriaceae bacterium]
MLQKTFNWLSLLSLLSILTFGIYSFTHQQSLVFVNSSELINGYKGMQDARKAYQQKATTWKTNIDTLANEVQSKIMDYEKESSKMTAKERQLSQELIRTKQKQLADYQQAMNTQAQQEDSKMTGEVVTQINSYLKKYGKSHGYKIVLAATEYGNIAYADEGLDITKEVLEGLNKEYSGQ